MILFLTSLIALLLLGRKDGRFSLTALIVNCFKLIFLIALLILLIMLITQQNVIQIYVES